MTMADILTYGFPGGRWSLVEFPGETAEQNYARLVWNGPGAKPTLEAILAMEAPAAAAMAAAAMAAAPKELVKAAFADEATGADAVRAVALVALDEINVLRQWITSFKEATAAASSLADLKTRVAALANMPGRTGAQLKAAVRDKIDQ